MFALVDLTQLKHERCIRPVPESLENLQKTFSLEKRSHVLGEHEEGGKENSNEFMLLESVTLTSSR